VGSLTQALFSKKSNNAVHISASAAGTPKCAAGSAARAKPRMPVNVG
jgi:hypothetical protein